MPSAWVPTRAPIALDVLANDTYLPDAPETLTITAVTQPTTGGSVSFTPTDVSFTPTASFQGTVTFTYTISDGNGGTDTATVTVVVGNNPPVANADSYTVDEDSGEHDAQRAGQRLDGAGHGRDADHHRHVTRPRAAR